MQMQSACLRTLADPTCWRRGQGPARYIHPLSGAQLHQIVTDFYTMPHNVKGSLRPVLATAT
jgi:hypothetical protein